MHTKQIMGLMLIILLTMLLLNSVYSEEPIDYYTPENVLKFADYLFEQGDYIRATNEYQRYLFYQPKDSEEIRYKIALCYRLGGNQEQSIHAFQELLKRSTDSTLVSKAYLQIGVSYYLLEQFGKSAEHLEKSLPHISELRYRAEVEQIIGLSFLMQRKWESAEDIFNRLQQVDVIDVREQATIYSKYANEGKQLPRRSPFLAGLMSSVVPGSGRLYAGRVNDALTSLITVGITSWQAYDGFRRDGLSSVKGWTLGSLSGIFYLGNIYGSVISAQVYNHQVSEEFLSTLYITLPY